MTDTTKVKDGDSRSADSERSASRSVDWVVPAILVAIVVVLALIIGIVAGVRAGGGDDDTVAGQFERWSSCLRSEGANVPLVESIRGGGFRVTVDGSLIEDGIDKEALLPAMERCRDEAPEGVRKVLTLMDGFSDLPFDPFGTGVFGLDDSHGTNRR